MRSHLPLARLAATPATLVALLAAASAAHAAPATTLGTTSLPSGATMPASACSTGSQTELLPYATDSGESYVVPSGGGAITSWSFNAAGATAGTPYTLIVVAPSGSSETIVATDPETVPSNPPAIVTFTLAQPIAVQAGDLIGVMVAPKSHVGCLFKGGSIPSDDVAGFTLTPDTVGNTFTLDKTINNELVNVSATVSQSDDVAISQTAEPSAITLGDDGVFVLDVTDSGPSSSAVTVTDTLPTGLTPVSASAGTGTCTTAGQTITCQVASAPASIAVVATASATGSYVNSATASGSLPDPDLANNSSTSTLTVKPKKVTTNSALAPTGLAPLTVTGPVFV